jgi:hypothetical protein
MDTALGFSSQQALRTEPESVARQPVMLIAHGASKVLVLSTHYTTGFDYH